MQNKRFNKYLKRQTTRNDLKKNNIFLIKFDQKKGGFGFINSGADLEGEKWIHTSGDINHSGYISKPKITTDASQSVDKK